jgi:hypothetical protein
MTKTKEQEKANKTKNSKLKCIGKNVHSGFAK